MKPLLKTILLIINIVTAVALLFSAYGGYCNPQVWAIPSIAFMVFPGLLAWAILLLFIDLICWKRSAVIVSVGILLSAPAIWNFCPMNISSGDPSVGTFKVMSYNNYEYCLYTPDGNIYCPDSTISIIAAEQPDIVLLQEAGRDPWQILETTDSLYHLKEVYPYVLKHITSSVIMSRYPLEEIELMQPDDPSGRFQGARIYMGNDTLTVFNIHLQSIYLTDDDKVLYKELTGGHEVTAGELKEARHTLVAKLADAYRERARQAKLLRSQLDTIPTGGRVIVGGDFNDLNGCWAMHEICGKELHNTFTAVGQGPAITYWASRFYFNIDHLLYGKALQPVSMKTIYTKASDHYPITATYYFK